MRFSKLRWSAAPLGLALSACAGDEPMQPPPTPAPSAAIAIVSGNDQEGKAGEDLAEPFVVRVTNASGEGIGDVLVTWSLTSGAGRFTGSADEPSRTWTSPDGLARVTFVPTTLGSSTVRARATTVTGSLGGEVSFTAVATALVIGIGGWSNLFFGPDGSPDVTVPVGTTVEWMNWLDSATVTSTSEPPGGESFDSGMLFEGERFQFVPRVSGTWEYVDQVHEGEAGVTATLTAESSG